MTPDSMSCAESLTQNMPLLPQAEIRGVGRDQAYETESTVGDAKPHCAASPHPQRSEPRGRLFDAGGGDAAVGDGLADGDDGRARQVGIGRG